MRRESMSLSEHRSKTADRSLLLTLSKMAKTTQVHTSHCRKSLSNSLVVSETTGERMRAASPEFAGARMNCARAQSTEVKGEASLNRLLLAALPTSSSSKHRIARSTGPAWILRTCTGAQVTRGQDRCAALERAVGRPMAVRM